MPVYPRLSDAAALTELTDTGNYLDGAKAMLFKNDITPSVDSILADLTPADFSGYAMSAAVVWGAPFKDENGNLVVRAGSCEFNQTAATVTNTVYGWGLVGDPSGTPFLICAERFETPVQMIDSLCGVVVDPVYGFGR